MSPLSNLRRQLSTMSSEIGRLGDIVGHLDSLATVACADSMELSGASQKGSCCSSRSLNYRMKKNTLSGSLSSSGSSVYSFKQR